MTLTDPKLYLIFEGDDLPEGHSASQTVEGSYIINRSIGGKWQLLSGLKSSSDQITLRLARGCPTIEDLFATEGNIHAVLKDGQTAVFAGYVSTNLKWGVTEHGKEVLSITLEGVGTRLLQAPFIESGKHYFRCTANEAVYAIVNPLGIEIRTGDESKLPQNVSKDVDAGTTCRQLLDELFYECNAVYWFDENGRLCISTINPSTEDAPVYDSEDLYTHSGRAVQVSKALRSYKGARVRYTVLGEADNYLVYRNTTGQDSAHPYCNFPLQPGQFFDGAEFYSAEEWSAAQADEFREPTLIGAVNAESENALVGSGKIVNISNLAPKTDKGSSIDIRFTAAGGPNFSLLAHNGATSYSQNIWRLDLYASIIYEKSFGIVRTQIDGPQAGKGLLEEDMTWIHDKTNASKHANLLAQYHRYSSATYTFNAKSTIPLGSVIELKENTFSGLDVFVMVIGKEADSNSDIVRYTAVGVSTFDLTEEAYYQDETTPGTDNKATRGSLWLTGTALWGESYARGAQGIVDDMYLNVETGNLYRCIESGSATTARWQYIGNIKGKDASEEGLSYTLEYSLSTSPNQFIYYAQSIGSEAESVEFALGFTADETDNDLGLIDAVWDSSTYAKEWYKGLYVWQRIKITDEDGNVTYNEPVYCEELTKSLINGCILEVIPEEPTWEKNLAATGVDKTVTIRFSVVARSYGSISQFESALAAGDGVTITPYRKGNPLDPITVPAPSTKTHDSTTNLVVFTYAVTFNKGMDADGMTIDANIVDYYITPGSDPETTYPVGTDAEGTMTAVDVTVADPFGGLFPETKDAVSTIAEADALAYDYFEQEYEGAVYGATYSLNLSGDNFLALRTYTPGGWMFLSVTGFDQSRISAICGKAQKSVLAQLEAGTISATDYGYFNVVIANIVTASFIGSKQIELQRDEQGNPGMIYGGDVDVSQPAGQKTTGKGFYFDCDGNNEVSDIRVRGESVIEGNSRVEGKIVNINNEDQKVVFETYKDTSSDYTMQAVSKVDGTTTPDRFSYSEWRTRINTFCNSLTAGTLYPASGTITTQGNRSMPRRTMANVKRLTSVSSTVQTLVDEASQPTTGATDVSRVVWTNNMGKTIRLESVVIESQYSFNLFNKHDYGDTHVIVYESDGTTVYRDYGNNDDSGASYSGVSVPPGGKVWCAWGKSTRYTYSQQPGHITITYKESTNWSVGTNFCFTDGTSKLLTEALPSTGYGNEVQTFTCNGTTYQITFTAAASWPTGVYKYYGNFAWATAPEDSGGNPPVGTISTIMIDTGSFTYAGVTKTIKRITFSTTTLSVEATDGNTYDLSSGYYRAYTFSATTLGEIMGARSRNMMPVYDNNVRVGGGYVGTSDEPWYQGWAQAWQQSSKRDLKEDIEDYLGDALALLESVQVVRFHYKSDRDNPERYWHYGFIADDTDEAIATPQHNTMDLGNCIGVLIRGVQLLARELQQLKGGKT